MSLDPLMPIIRTVVEEKILFNKVLGLELATLSKDHISLKFSMKQELIGNFVRGCLHGGVISATLDVAGGLVAFVGIFQDVEEQLWDEKLSEKFSRIGTIDIRIDYLRPGIGQEFIATGSILRIGNKVAVTRMELHNENKELIAVGTGSYIVG